MKNPIFISELILKRFRSILSAKIPFENLTFLVGRNGAGKSNIVDIFQFLSDLMTVPLKAALDTRGGLDAVRHRSSQRGYPASMGLRLNFTIPMSNNIKKKGMYAFEIKALPKHQFEVVREQCRLEGNQEFEWFDRHVTSFSSSLGLKPSLDPQSLVLPIIGGTFEFMPVLKSIASMQVYSIVPSQIRELQSPDSGLRLQSDGSNITSVLQELQRSHEDVFKNLGELLKAVVPGINSVRTKKHAKKLSLEFTQSWSNGKNGQKSKEIKFESFSMSDGTLRAIGVLTALLQQPIPSLIVIEEPEATIHPGALGALMDGVRTSSRNTQIILTTHCPEILDFKWLNPDQIRVVDWQKGATQVYKPSQAAIESVRNNLMGLGDLMRSGILESGNELFEPHIAQLNLFED